MLQHHQAHAGFSLWSGPRGPDLMGTRADVEHDTTHTLYLDHTFTMQVFKGTDISPHPVGVSSPWSSPLPIISTIASTPLCHNILCLHMQKTLTVVSGCLRCHWPRNINVWETITIVCLPFIFIPTNVYTNTRLYKWSNCTVYPSVEKQIYITFIPRLLISGLIWDCYDNLTFSWGRNLRLQSGPSVLFIFR